MKKVFLNSALEVKGLTSSEDDPSVLKIAGYANYATKDRAEEIIVPDAWTKGLKNYEKNPIVLFGHDHNKPIGRVTKTRVDENGLYVEAIISSAAEKLYGTQTLIKDGSLKTFSVGFIPKKGRKDTASNTLYITEVELLETSVVSVPMQQDSIFSVVKSLNSNGDYEKFLAENVELFDSTEPENKAVSNVSINISVETTDTDNSIETEEEECDDPMDPNASTDPQEMSIRSAIVEQINSKPVTLDVTESNIIYAALANKSKIKIDSKEYVISKINLDTHSLEVQEVSILGNPINEILNIDINTLNILNLLKIDTSDYLVFTAIKSHTNEEISQLFAELVNADVNLLKENLKKDTLSSLEIKQLNYTISLKDKPVKDWSSDDYIVANKIVNYILFRSHLEADTKEHLLLLHGHVEEKSEMTQPVVTTAEQEVSQVAATTDTVSSPVASVAAPRVEGLIAATGKAMTDVAAAEGSSVPASKIKELEDQLAKLSAEYAANKDKIAAYSNEKIAFAANAGPTVSKKDIVNAMFLMHAKNPGADFSMENFAKTKMGSSILTQTKATITSVDALITDYTSELYEQMQIELKVAPMLRSINVTAQNFKIPVADEETNGDIAQFANGTYNLGETDSTRVPTTRQNTISAVNLTPHKFMGTTHLAKDEQEDVLIPLLDFQVRSLVRRMARAVDKALLRGDGSLSGFTASPTNAITAGTGYASVITGLATLAAAQSGLKVATGGVSTKATPTSIASARALTGRYGLDVGSNNLVYFTSIEGYNDLVTTSDFRTMDKFGDKATYVTGQVGSIYGIPVVITEFLDNVGISGNHVGLLVYLPGFIVGQRRAFEIESWYDPRRQLTAIYLSTRYDMKALTTNANAALDTTKYNMASVVTSN